MVFPPNGAVTVTVIGSDRRTPFGFTVPVTGSNTTAPSTDAVKLHDRAVAGNVESGGLTDRLIVIVAWYVNVTSFSITHGETIVSEQASANVIASPTAATVAST